MLPGPCDNDIPQGGHLLRKLGPGPAFDTSPPLEYSGSDVITNSSPLGRGLGPGKRTSLQDKRSRFGQSRSELTLYGDRVSIMITRPMRIDPLHVLPKYYQLCEIIRQKIEDGEWQPDQPIPSERELEATYAVSRTTVRQALNILVRQGYLYRKHGRGTFVAPPKLQYSLHLPTSFSAEMHMRGIQPGQQILEMEYVEPPARIRQHLELPPHVKEILRVDRLRFGDGEPVGLHEAYLPLAREQAITREELEASGSLYALLEARFNLIPSEAAQTVEATLADEREAALLGIRKGSPLLLIERTTWSQTRRPMEFVKMLYRADRYKCYIHITR